MNLTSKKLLAFSIFIIISTLILTSYSNANEKGKVFFEESSIDHGLKEYILDLAELKESVENFSISPNNTYILFDPCNVNKAEIRSTGVKNAVAFLHFKPGRLELSFPDINITPEFVSNFDSEGPIKGVRFECNTSSCVLNFRFNERKPNIDIKFGIHSRIIIKHADRIAFPDFEGLLNVNTQVTHAMAGMEMEVEAAKTYTQKAKELLGKINFAIAQRSTNVSAVLQEKIRLFNRATMPDFMYNYRYPEDSCN